jgi:hypothetical protein
MKQFFLAIIFVFSLTAMAFPLSTATLSGRVFDANGVSVAGAKIEIINIATNAKITVTTNNDGFYILPELIPAAYRIEVGKDGFQSSVRENVTLNVGANTTLNFTLSVGKIEEKVTVDAGETELVERDSAAVGTLVTRKFIENLPLNGRSFQTLIELTPGVNLVPTTTQSTGQFSVNGQRSNANYFTSKRLGVCPDFRFSAAQTRSLRLMQCRNFASKLRPTMPNSDGSPADRFR